MEIQNAYNIWASQYDSNLNKTRDLEGVALKATLKDTEFDNCLEIGCGTGKNTVWLSRKARFVTAADFSTEMLSKAREKVVSEQVQFIQTDITLEWPFKTGFYDLITFSLVLEHISNLDHIFSEASKCLKDGGFMYIGELHPFKQYAGSKARFDTEEGRHVLDCYIHHISDFIKAAKQHGFDLVTVDEFFDDDNRLSIPLIITLLLKK